VRKPWRLSGGMIEQVIVNVSDAPREHLILEATAMLSRE
jgi:hypothetical protein